MDAVRIGTLGAARITPRALIAPARQLPEVFVGAVAARDHQRAEKFAARYGIPTVHKTYEDLVADPKLDAIYIPLPNSLHYQWVLEALEAGKHVLCEKPFASNAVQAEAILQAAGSGELVVMEAFHYRYHPVAERMRDIAQSGELGEIEHIETSMCIPLPIPGDIRYRADLGGGATMDVGSYAIHMLRTLAGMEPTVTGAASKRTSPEIDRWMRADFEFPSGATGRMTCSLMSMQLLKIAAYVRGSTGEMWVFNPVVPQIYHHIKVKGEFGTRIERLSRISSYEYQLRAFTRAIREGASIYTGPEDALANMRIIDAVYRAAGMEPRS